jgi:hypothetical protein
VARKRMGLGLGLALALAACGGGDKAAGADQPAAGGAPRTDTTVATPPAQAGTPAAKPPATATATAQKADAAERARLAAARADTGSTEDGTVTRESFAYGGGSRDPFMSLLDLESAGPELPDLQLVAVYQDLAYSSNSLAVLRDRTSGKRYKLRAGDELGRLKVAQIRQKDVVFIVEDFGFERQETVSLPKREEETP